MKTHCRSFRRLVNQRGMALPMTMIVLTLITTLALAFMVLGASEPVIANNHMASAQARAVAESGVERALWALSMGTISPTTPGAAEEPLAGPTAASPYNGDTYFAMGNGEFQVWIMEDNNVPPKATERRIKAVGYVPNHNNPVAIKTIEMKAARMKWLDPPCAICAGGEQPPMATTDIRIGGSAHVSAATTDGAQYCAGVMPTAATLSQGTVSTNGNPTLTPPPGGVGALPNQPSSSFNSFQFTNDDMAMLRDMAKASGTYLKGNQTFTSPPPNGIVFIDTPSGNPFTNDSPSSDIIEVDVHGNWSQGWSGWLIVAGSARLSGNISMTGLLYAQNDVTLHGAGGGGFAGAVISTNRMDTTSSRVSDVEDIGNAPITYNCPAVRDGGGTITQHWFTKPGTFKEVAGY